jgi:hypothetical protein
LAGGQRPEGQRELDIFSSLDLEPSDPDEVSDLTHQEVAKTLRLARLASDRMVNQLMNRPLKSFPPLGDLRFKVVFLEKSKVGFIKERCLQLCLRILRDFLDKGCEPDADEAFVEIHREFLDEQDPLFGSDLRFSLDEEELQDENDRYSNLLPGLEQRVIPYMGRDADLVFLGKGSGLDDC